MTNPNRRVLVLTYGNPARLDDGLGVAAAEALEEADLAGVSIDTDYQLHVEQAAEIADHDVVVFIDAAVAGPEPFAFTRVSPRPGVGFTTHRVEPSQLLALAHELLGATTRGYLLAIRGYAFDDFGERLSKGAARNLVEALTFLEPMLETLVGGEDDAEAVSDPSSPPRSVEEKTTHLFRTRRVG